MTRTMDYLFGYAPLGVGINPDRADIIVRIVGDTISDGGENC